MNRRLLITGCGGFVAGSIVRQAENSGWAVHAISRGKPLAVWPGLTWHTEDFLSPSFTELFRSISPDTVIHCAAMADIDFCETHADMAQAVNVAGTERLAQLCEDRKTRFIYLSTDTVFDGRRGRYTEEDPPSPLNVYAATKAAGEYITTALPCPYVVARVALVMGLPMLGAGNSFLSRMLPALQAGKTITVPGDEIRSPIDVVTVARALLELAENEYVGCIHLAGNDILPRFEMACRIAHCLHLDENLITMRTQPPEGWVPRPLDASLVNTKAVQLLKTPMLGLEQGLNLVMEYAKT